MSKDRIKVLVHTDRKRCHFTVRTGRGPVGVELATDDVAEAIDKLCAARIEMQPGVSVSPQGAQVRLFRNGEYFVPDADAEGQRVVLLRHPALGWVGVSLDKANARNLAEALLKDGSVDEPVGTA